MANNNAQEENWNGPGGQSWVTYQERIDAAAVAFSSACMERLQAKPGERIIDVGCGAGTTSMELAKQVGAQGQVLGLDFSKPLLQLAEKRAESIANVSFECGDAGQARSQQDYDALFSRFGVMFFDRPALAFSNLRSTLSPEGRLAFICWQGPDKNPWIAEPMARLLPFLDEAPPAPKPNAPGAFGLADRAYARRELSKAGYQDIEIEPFTADMILGTQGVDSAVEFTMQLGPGASLVEGASASTVEQIHASLAEFFEQYRNGDVVALPGAAWLITARA